MQELIEKTKMVVEFLFFFLMFCFFVFISSNYNNYILEFFKKIISDLEF